MDKWRSKELWEHPAEHQKGVYGFVCLSGAGVYYLQVGGASMGCPQTWAGRVHAQETGRVGVSPVDRADLAGADRGGSKEVTPY